MYRPDPKPGKRAKKSRRIPHEIVAAVLIRDNLTCQSCRRMFAPEDHALQMHHLVYRSQGGKDIMCNLVSLCADCHREIHDRHGWKEYELLKKFTTAYSVEEYERKIARIAARLGV